MLIRHFEYLVALARERHFARAAAACNVTQPALSAGIKQLEECFGVPIVERGNRFQGLTAEGERVLLWARHLLAERDNLFQELTVMGPGMAGHLRIGGIPVALPALSLLTTPFASRYPRVRITVSSVSSIEIQRGLDEWTLDVGLTYLDNEPLARVRPLPLYREHYVLLTAADGPFAARTSVTWREVAGLRLCLLTHAMQNRRIVDAYFQGAGAEPDAALETNSLVTLATHVRGGGWSTVLPHTIGCLISDASRIRMLPLVEPEGSHAIGLIVPDRDPVSPVAAALLAEARTIDMQEAIREAASSARELIGIG